MKKTQILASIPFLTKTPELTITSVISSLPQKTVLDVRQFTKAKVSLIGCTGGRALSKWSMGVPSNYVEHQQGEGCRINGEIDLTNLDYITVILGCDWGAGSQFTEAYNLGLLPKTTVSNNNLNNIYPSYNFSSIEKGAKWNMSDYLPDRNDVIWMAGGGGNGGGSAGGTAITGGNSNYPNGDNNSNNSSIGGTQIAMGTPGNTDSKGKGFLGKLGMNNGVLTGGAGGAGWYGGGGTTSTVPASAGSSYTDTVYTINKTFTRSYGGKARAIFTFI